MVSVVVLDPESSLYSALVFQPFVLTESFRLRNSGTVTLDNGLRTGLSFRTFLATPLSPFYSSPLFLRLFVPFPLRCKGEFGGPHLCTKGYVDLCLLPFCDTIPNLSEALQESFTEELCLHL